MTMIAYKYRIYPTTEQETTLVGWMGQLRFVWNKLGELKKSIPQELRKFTPVEIPLSGVIRLYHLDMHRLKQESFLRWKESVGL